MDFTLRKYKELLLSLKNCGYTFITFAEYCKGVEFDRFIIMRHDVDEMSQNALKMAQLEHSLDIRATYNFRIVRQSNNPEVIREIVRLGHELGYHYEDLVLSEGNTERAIENFRINLDYFRTYAAVETVCMHGSSSSAYDNRDLWKIYDLNQFGLLGEPYLTIDFSRIFYLTDTGYCWDGRKTAVRDVVKSTINLSFHSTDEVISAINENVFPNKAMILAHTLWTDSISKWIFIFFRELLRNKIKRMSRNNAFVRRIYGTFVRIYWKK